MPLGFRSIAGLTFNQMNDGLITIAEIPGDPGMGPSQAVITVFASGLPPNTPAINIQLLPSGHTSFGTDINGNISATATFVNSGNDKLFSISGGGSATFTNGFWAQAIRGVCNNSTGSYGFDIQFLTLDTATDFPNALNDPPTNASNAGASYDPITDEGNVTIDWQYTNPTSENPDGFAILRDGVAIGSVPIGVGPDYSFQDFVFTGGNYTYTIQAYKYGAPNAISAPSNTLLALISVRSAIKVLRKIEFGPI